MIHLITGGAGFIGSHLVSRLANQGHKVIVFDDLSLGHVHHLDSQCTFIKVDCADVDKFAGAVERVLGGCSADVLWHLAANSDIPAGIADPDVDCRRTFMTTFNALRIMQTFNIPVFHFSSSSAIYGEHGTIAVREDTGPLMPISNYGAMKLASEAQICALLESYGKKASIFRFPNVVGSPATHGVILDFVNKLRADSTRLDVLGDGTQQKPYLHVSDLVSAMLFIAEHGKEKINLYNIGPDDDGVTVRFIAETVRDYVAPEAKIIYGNWNRGWVGDVPRFRYATGKLTVLGWQPTMTSEDAIRRTVREVAERMPA